MITPRSKPIRLEDTRGDRGACARAIFLASAVGSFALDLVNAFLIVGFFILAAALAVSRLADFFRS